MPPLRSDAVSFLVGEKTRIDACSDETVQMHDLSGLVRFPGRPLPVPFYDDKCPDSTQLAEQFLKLGRESKVSDINFTGWKNMRKLLKNDDPVLMMDLFPGQVKTLDKLVVLDESCKPQKHSLCRRVIALDNVMPDQQIVVLYQITEVLAGGVLKLKPVSKFWQASRYVLKVQVQTATEVQYVLYDPDVPGQKEAMFRAELYVLLYDAFQRIHGKVPVKIPKEPDMPVPAMSVQAEWVDPPVVKRANRMQLGAGPSETPAQSQTSKKAKVTPAQICPDEQMVATLMGDFRALSKEYQLIMLDQIIAHLDK
jgi:hypothetical protein